MLNGVAKFPLQGPGNISEEGVEVVGAGGWEAMM